MADTIPHIVNENDPELESGMAEYGSCTGYLSRPKGGAGLGSVIVIHENVGLVDHIKDVARHFAKEGFAALAPDMLQRTGGTAQYQTSQDAIAAIRSLDPAGCVEDLTSALEYLKSQGFANGNVGVVGYCWGGGQSLNFATKCNQLDAAVVYYGRNPDPLEQVANITCPLMGNYAEDDPNIMPGIEPLKADLVAMMAFASAMQGFFADRCGWPERALLAVICLAAFRPDLLVGNTDSLRMTVQFGAWVLFAGLYLVQRRRRGAGLAAA